MERFVYWIRRIMKHKWKECRSFCGTCGYYRDCKSDTGDLADDSKSSQKRKLQKEKFDFRDESRTIVI